MGKDQVDIANLILSYLKRKPDAGDTLEGITKWWLKMDHIEISIDQVVEACNNLIEKDIIKKCIQPNGTVLYLFNRKEYLQYLIKSIENGSKWVVFEPNDRRLWTSLKKNIKQFLYKEWRDGFLKGSTPKEAFFVKCDRTTMTQEDIDQGRLIIQIGIAPKKPTKFVIFNIVQHAGENCNFLNINHSNWVTRIKPNATWCNLNINEEKKSTLREIIEIKKSQKLHKDDCRSIRGICILFLGGDKKEMIMAAEVLATELCLPLYRIDLRSVVSKYISETEKNLDKILSRAENTDVILLFDDADELFGKRTEVKDPHNKYENIETNYLLESIEEYKGIVILASNRREEDFSRRFRFIIYFS